MRRVRAMSRVAGSVLLAIVVCFGCGELWGSASADEPDKASVRQSSSPQGNRGALLSTALSPAQQGVPAVGGGASTPQRNLPAKPVPVRHGPLVSYQGGELTIDAENTTLAAVLALVAEKTGAAIDVPPGSGLEQIVVHAGPGPANDVLTQMLNGSHFNFIIVGSPLYPDEPVQVLLSLKADGGAVVAAAPAAPPAAPPAGVPEGLSAPALPAETYVEPAPVVAPPKEPMTPDQLQQAMKDRAQELRERLQQQRENAQPQ